MEIWPDGSNYKGQYFKGKKHGKGKIQFVDGAVYEGDLEMNVLKGTGTYTWID